MEYEVIDKIGDPRKTLKEKERLGNVDIFKYTS